MMACHVQICHHISFQILFCTLHDPQQIDSLLLLCRNPEDLKNSCIHKRPGVDAMLQWERNSLRYVVFWSCFWQLRLQFCEQARVGFVHFSFNPLKKCSWVVIVWLTEVCSTLFVCKSSWIKGSVGYVSMLWVWRLRTSAAAREDMKKPIIVAFKWEIGMPVAFFL